MNRFIAAVVISVAPLWFGLPLEGALVGADGRIVFLRVHELGTGYGPPEDFLDTEVVVKLDTEPGKSFGLQLRDDAKYPAREAMLGLLRDAFANNWLVRLEYEIPPGKTNGVIVRVILTK